MKWLLLHIVLLFGVQMAEAYTPIAVEPDTVTIRVNGSMEDARFDPETVVVDPGTVLRFKVTEGTHTVTAYHPDNRRTLGIPESASSFDSELLAAGDTWYLRVVAEGEYNYFCRPHERMGHTGRIVVKSIMN